MKLSYITRLSRFVLMIFAIILACQKDPLIDALKPQISLLQMEYNQSKLRLDRLKAENTELKQKLSSLQESYALLQKQYQDELSASEVLQNEINDVEKQLQTAIESHNLKRSMLLTELDELKEKTENNSEELKQHQENQKLIDEVTKTIHQNEQSQSALQELQRKIAVFQSGLKEHMLQKKQYEDLESEHVSKLDEISQLEEQIKKAEDTLEKLRLDAEINQLEQQLSKEKVTNELIEKVENDLADLNQEIKKLSAFADLLPKLQESLSETIENEKKLRLQLGDLKHEFDVLTGDPPNPPPVMNGPAIQVDHDMPKRLFIGDVFQLNYSFFNEEGVLTQPTGLVLWSSDNEKIIEINEVSGEVQAMSLGTAEISITTQINDQIYEDTLTINVSRLLQQRVEIVENIPRVFMPLQNHQLELAYFNERDEKVSQPQGEVTWESSDSQIIRVNPNTGEITALKSGSATIKVTLEHPENGVMTFSYTIQVQTDSIQPRLVIHNKPNNSRININETYDLNFEYYNSSGQKVEPPSGFIVVWNSTDTTKVDINPITGVVRGVALGTSSISVSTVIEGEIISDQFSLTVSSDSVPSNGHRIEIIEDDFPDPFLVGQTHRFTVHFFDSDGNQITAPSGTAVWKSSKNRNARPNSDNSGDVTAERKGNATITVTFTISSNSQVLTDTYDITVEQGPAIRIIENLPSNFTPPQKHTLTYNYWNANGAKVDPPDGIRWKSATKSVATIDNSTGEVTAVGAGKSVITITTQEKNKDNRIDDTYEITVIGGDPPTIEPELRMIDLPTNSTITINGTQDLDFEYYDNTGTKGDLPQGVTVTWTSSDTTKITIDATTGVITGVAAGTSDITASATIGGSTITATETITVSAGSLRNDGSYITIQEDLPQLFFVGQTHMFAIKHYDSSDTEIAQPAGSAEWTASNSGMTFSTTTIGQGTAATAGTITITVRYTFDSDGNYLEDTYEIEVLQGPLVRIVEDIPEGFKKGQTHTLTADYYNSSGQKVTHPDGLTWTSRNADVATINRDSGLLTAVGPGTVTVVARTKGSTPRQSDTYAFTVLADSELKIIDLPPSSSITLSTSHDLNFEFYNSSGTKVNLPPGATVSWTSSDVSKVSVVSGTGVITGTGIGEADITASTTIDGAPITTKATISVVAGSIRTDGSRIEILDDLPDPFLVGQTHTFSIKYYDSTNAEITPLPAGSYEWTTSNNRITFSSSNSGVGVAAGAKVVTITVRYIFNSDGSYLEATYRLKVIQGPLVQITEDIPEGFKKGQTHPLAAEYYNATGNKVDYPGTGGLIWSSSDETVATVDSSTGEVTAVGPGTVTITVKTQEFGTNSREEEKDAYEFTVLTDPKLVIVDLPASSTIASNGTHDLNFEYYDNTGTKVDLPQGATFTWTSSDTTKITIDASTGVITSVSAGNSDITISATISGSTITATENIIVSASSLRNDGTYITIQEDLTRLFFVGQMHPFTIKHYNSSDTEIAEPAGSAVWTDSNSGITFSTTTIGQGTAAAAGSTTITVRYTFDSDGNYLEDTYEIEVLQGPLVRILEDLPEGFKKGDPHTLTAEYYNASGTKMTHPDGLSWSTSDDAVATVDSSTGEVTAIGLGTVTITVTTQESDEMSQISDTYEFDVLTDPEIAIIDLPTNSSINVGGTETLDYEYYDNTGTKVDLPQGSTVTWTSSDSTKVSVDSSTGEITGVAAGSADITVTVSGTSISSTETIMVLGIARNDGSRIVINENIPDPFLVGQTHPFTFTYYDSSSMETNVPAGSAEWTNSNGRITFSSMNLGEGTGADKGRTRIILKYTFDSDGNFLVDEYRPFVIQGPLVQIIENIPEGFKIGQPSHTLTAEYYNATGNKVNYPGTGGLIWSSSDETVATVDSSTGEVTAVGLGTVTITVKTQEFGTNSRDEEEDAYEFTVLTKPKLVIVDPPETPSIIINNTHDLGYEYFDNTGTKVNLPMGATVTWTSSDTTKITIDSSTGVMTGVATGSSNITVSTTIDGETIISEELEIFVFASRGIPVSVDIIEDLPDPFVVGQNYTLKFDYYDNVGKTTKPTGTTTWASSKNKNASITNAGVLTAERAGTTEITLTFRTLSPGIGNVDLTDTYDIRVDDAGPAIRIIEDIPSTFAVGDTHTLTYLYWNVSNQYVASPTGVRWTISKGSEKGIVTIDPDSGVITALKAGTTTIKIRTKEDNKNERVDNTYEITVN